MKPYEVRDKISKLTKMDKENLRALATLKTLDQLADMKRLAVEQDNDQGVVLTSAAMYLRAFFEAGVI